MKYNKDKQSVAKKCTLLLNTIYYDEDSMDNSSTKKELLKF